MSYDARLRCPVYLQGARESAWWVGFVAGLALVAIAQQVE